jgi:hypothetical protein
MNTDANAKRDKVEFALRDAGFDYDDAARIAMLAHPIVSTNAGPVLPALLEHPDYCTPAGWAQREVRDIEAYGRQCWNACDKHVAGPLREALSECATAVGAGVSPDCSVEFLREVPREVELVVAKLRERVAQLEIDVEYYRREADKLRLRIMTGKKCVAELEAERSEAARLSHQYRNEAERQQKRVAELEAQNAELERLCDEKYCATGADAYYHCCGQTEAWDADRLTKGLAPIYGPGEGRSLCGWIESIRELLDNAEADRDRLRAENARLIEDRARFPDRPDDIGNMIGAHIGNLEAKADATEVAYHKVQLALDVSRAQNEALTWLVSKELVAHRMVDTGLWMIVTGEGYPAIDGSEHETALAAIDAARAAREGK